MPRIRKILFITLSNIGDTILTFPALEVLRANFPQSKIKIIAGESSAELFRENEEFSDIIIFNKKDSFKDKLDLFLQLRKERFDAVVDLRNSMWGIFYPAVYKTTPFSFILSSRKFRHKREFNLMLLRRAFWPMRLDLHTTRRLFFPASKDDVLLAGILADSGVEKKETWITVACGAKSALKRWPKENFVSLIRCLHRKFALKIILVGDKNDTLISSDICSQLDFPVVDFTGKTNFSQLAALLRRSRLLISNDSGILHLASYLDIPVVAVFGPTDETKYGPWSKGSVVVKKNIPCRPCQKANCKFKNVDCLRLINPQEVLKAVEDVLKN